MTVIQTKYFPGRLGLGTEFSFSQMPLEYCRSLKNRFINVRGDAEKRQGISQIGNTISGLPNITGLHEFADRFGNVTLFASSAGVIYKYDSVANTWSTALSGKDASKSILSTQMGDKLIFVNGSDRNFYTDDGSTFKELEAIMEMGTASSTATNSTSMTDADVLSWTGLTFVTNNDLLFNATVSAYAFVTSVGATNITHSPISNSAAGIGNATRTPATGDVYRISDLVEMNIIPTGVELDNFATLTSGSSTNQIRVSGLNFSSTEVQVGDYFYNTTRNAAGRITAVSANLTVSPITGQVVNDTVTFHKSAMPIATWGHVHYGRFYMIDARDEKTVRISGSDDPQDMTTYQKTIESGSSFYGSRQPQAERLLSLKTFQQYLVAAGQRNVYVDSGTTPIADTSAKTVDAIPVGLFPQGCVSRFGLESIGGSMVFASNDGLRNFTAIFNNQTFQTSNLSEVIKSEVISLLQSSESDPDKIQTIHYPRRNWVLFKVGDVIYNYNYTPSYNQGEVQQKTYGSFSKFTGKFAQQNVYFVRKDGDVLCAGANGKVYLFDHGSYNDDGDTIQTELVSAFLSMIEPQESTQIKSGVYIKPIFETSVPITYTIDVDGGYEANNRDETSLTTKGVGQVGFGVVGLSPVGGSRVNQHKLPLRWKGEKCQVTITTDNSLGPDIITGFTLYGNVLGKG